MKIPYMCRTCNCLEHFSGNEYGCSRKTCIYDDKNARVRTDSLTETLRKNTAMNTSKRKDHFSDRHHIPFPF